MRKINNSGPSPRSRRDRGVTLIELLVAMVISLIAITAIFQVFSVFEGQKRTTMGGGEAQTNGALSLFTLERDIRQAGYGITDLAFLGCTINGWDEQAGGGTAFTLTLVPVVITQGVGSTSGVAGAPDTVTVMYGSGELLPNPVNITQDMPSPSADYKVSNRYGFNPGDMIIVAEPGKDCTLAQVSTLPGTPGQTDNIIHNSGTYTDPITGVQRPTRYNKPGGLGTAYTTAAKMFNIGSLPNNNIYSVSNGQLMLQLLLTASSTAPTAIYDSIVQLQAQYGRDTNADGIIDVFDEFVPATAADWATILAVRLAVIARSALFEKGVVSPATIKLWDDSAVAPTTVGPVWTLTANERQYRYKVFQTVVPVRNMLWRP
ncbi:MAG: PilW family protein [Betaproteobacteria bacterium]|nr:PilW family protein [Betaproteobacteria bacterium]MDH3437597.1 PilW family protein [Betaproteobacteria bacterium]